MHHKSQNIQPRRMLLPARTDTRWFHEFIYGKAEIRFVRGRLKFGNATNSAPFPSMVVVWRGDRGMKERVLWACRACAAADGKPC